MRRALLVILAALSIGLLAGCSASASSPNRVDVAAFEKVVATPGTSIIDVRTPAEFAAEHLQGATNIDVEAPDFASRIAGLDKATTYAVYCRSGNRSRTATQQMADAGFTALYDLEGGINAWVAAGQPVVQ